MPKLLYRNASLDGPSDSPDKSMSAISAGVSGIAITSDSPAQSDLSSPSLASSSSTDGSNASNSSGKGSQSTYLSPPASAKSTKKKGSSFFSFLSVKEPSTQAFLDYQESIRRHQESKDGRITAVGMPMVSSQKLPAKVPKVNSKWDGVPEAVIQREKEKKARQQALGSHRRRPSNACSTGTSRSRSSSRVSDRKADHRKSRFSINSYGAVPPSSGSDTSFRSEIPPTPSSVYTKDFASIFTTSLGSAPQTPLSEVGSFVSGPSDVPKMPFNSRNVSQSSFDNSQSPTSPAPTSTGLLPLPSSPRNPATRNLAIERLHSTPQTSPSNIHTTVLTIPSEDRVIIKSTGQNILGPPASARRRSKSTVPFLAGEAQEMQFPDEELQSILKDDATARKTQGTARPPISAYFPSVEKAKNASSQGLPLRNQYIPPWGSSEKKSADGRRDYTPMPQGNKATVRKNRMSLFKS